MAIDFPGTPTNNQEFTAAGRTWIYDGTAWNAKGVPVSINSSQVTTTVTNKSANYTIQASDENTIIRSTGSAITITIANVLNLGEAVQFQQSGTGQITFVAGAGVTIGSVDSKLKTNKQHSPATVICVASGVYALIGDLAA